MSIEVQGVAKRFGGFIAVDHVDLSIASGELVALLGPSGCGKTTLLRLIAGLERPDAGKILFLGEDATQKHVRERGVGFVFQHYALFRHMTVFENVAFGLRVRPKKNRPPENVIRDKVHELLRLVQMAPFSGRFPHQLSGGQRQRIALARALAVEPKVLLLDEPFGALDAQVRRELRRWLRRLHDELGITSVFVTHDQEEAFEVSDRIVVMRSGKVEQAGTPHEIYEFPASPFVFEFLGNVSRFDGEVRQNRFFSQGISLPVKEGSPPGQAVAFARAHEFEVIPGPCLEEGVLAIVEHAFPFGGMMRLELRPQGGGPAFDVEIPLGHFSELGIRRGQEVVVRPTRLAIFSSQEQQEEKKPVAGRAGAVLN